MLSTEQTVVGKRDRYDSRGKDHLDLVDAEGTHGIAHLGIHVERVIGLLRRKYTILSGILPIDFLL